MIRPVVGNEPLIPTSTKDLETTEIQLYPNPSRGRVFFDKMDPIDRVNWQVEVFNLLGQILKQGDLNEFIDLSNFEAGTYVVKLHHLKSKKQVVQKIMILN